MATVEIKSQPDFGCVVCGSSDNIINIVHKNQNNIVVGFVFMCRGCASAIEGIEVDVKILQYQ